MSNVAEAIDFRGGMVQWLGTLNHFYTSDIKAIPEDQLQTSPGGVARTPAQISAEVVGLLNWTAAMLKGETPAEQSEEAMAAESVNYTSHDFICNAMNAAVENLSGAIAGANDATFAKVVTPPWQMDAPLMAITQVAVNHIWYHDGQLNYFQALNGDSKVHWM